jgi:membrane-bound metal-dependent hydrolase YbcI (DUF457 family)
MPTPLAHGVAGSAVARTARNDWRSWRFIVLAFVIANLPDLDFIPGIFMGDAGAVHRRATHSVFAAVVVSLPVAALLCRRGPEWFGRTFTNGAKRPGFMDWYIFVAPVYASHLLLDLVSLDTVQNSGLQMWWPFSNAYVTAPLPMPAGLRAFFDLQFGPTAADFFRTLFSGHALAVYLTEALIFSPLLLVPFVVGRLRNRGQARRPRTRERDASASGPESTIVPPV